MTSTIERVTARDGTARLVRHWVPTAEPWLHLLLLHGLGEHSGRYERVGRQVAAAGIALDAFDHAGFGASDGRRGDIDRWSHFHDDVEDRLAAVRGRAGGAPVGLYGHSLGGLMALGYVLSARPVPDLLVLTSPGLDDALPAWMHVLARFLGRVAPRLSIANTVRGEVLSRDPAVGADYLDDPLNHHRATFRLGREGFAEQARVRARLADIDGLGVPTYVAHGSDDRLVPPSASEVLDGRPGVTRVVLPGLRHETHNEPEGPEVVDGIVAWLRTQVAGRASGGGEPGG